jgi:heme A synthase
MSRARFRIFAWATLAYVLAVILWGAYVRASGSGAGCGAHWPTCDGEILPRPKTLQMLVELTHRLTSGLSGALVVVELGWALWAFPKGHVVRAGAALSLILMITEGAVGAALVLLEHVASDPSMARAAWTSLHLCNTFLLVAALAATAHGAGGEGGEGERPRLVGQGRAGTLLVVGAVLLTAVGASGAVTALGDTLFTSPSLARGVADDFSPSAHFLQQLRVVHPIAATLVAVFVLYARGTIAAGRGEEAARFSRVLAALVVGQLLLGLLNFALQAPIAMQLVHLLIADLVWIAFVLLGASALAAPALAAPAPSLRR